MANGTWWKLAVAVLSVCLLVCGAGIYKYYTQASNLQSVLASHQTQLMQSNLKLGRAHTQLSDARDKIVLMSEQIQKEVKDREAVVKLYAELDAKHQVSEREVKTITRILYKDREIPFPKGSIFYRKDDKYYALNSLTYNYKDFRITISGDAIKGTLSYKLHQDFNVKFVESHVSGGAINHYAELYEMNGKNKVKKLEITKFEVVKSKDLESKFDWWNPKLDLLLAVGLDLPAPDISWTTDVGISFMSYGKTDNDLSWRFLRLGLGMSDETLSVSFVPVLYNVGQNLPLVSNIWLSLIGSYKPVINSGSVALGVSVVF